MGFGDLARRVPDEGVGEGGGVFGQVGRGGVEPGGEIAVKNGTLGRVLAVESKGERLTVRLDGVAGGQVATFYLRDYAHVEHGYAATIHKAQGVTVERDAGVQRCRGELGV